MITAELWDFETVAPFCAKLCVISGIRRERFRPLIRAGKAGYCRR